MGAGNYLYRSAIMEQQQTEEYTWMVYVDEYGHGDGEVIEDFDWEHDSMRADILGLLQSQLKGFEAAEAPSGAGMFYRDNWLSRDNEEVLGYVGRMAVIAASTYDGDRVAIVVAPNEEWQQYVWGIESDPNSYRIDWHYCNAGERARWASAIRSLNCGGLSHEMAAVSDKVLKIFERHIGSERLSFRTSAWTSARYHPQLAAA